MGGMDWSWGPLVQWCRWWDHTGDFCKFCAAVSRAYHIYILKHNPTFIGVDVPIEKPPTEAGG